MKRILIISDGKPGHLNQSIAFCKIKNISYDILEVKFKTKLHKAMSYFFDRINYYTDDLFEEYRKYYYEFYDAVISTGSGTYYFNKFISKNQNKKSIVLMLPKGYKFIDFDYIIAQEHDNFPKLDNILEIPLNLSFPKPKNILQKVEDKKAIGIIIGGNNSVFTLDTDNLRNELNLIFKKQRDSLKYITTSARTPFEVDGLIDEYDFDYKLIYSREPEINPVYDFINVCDELYITQDSTSMLSEARANTNAKINIINLKSKKENTKYHRLVEKVSSMERKVDFEKLLERVEI
ncbi:ELM1/GtrOC1 family putative glycosyltransferase [Arcobacter sp. YIC-80]|uniref:ELM1/GtrOC1 family putative glycosyltransferase n=1 Tax=Arcobacter sp. YIC-80 TaxID=3376683 RepID=UPI0038508BFA